MAPHLNVQGEGHDSLIEKARRGDPTAFETLYREQIAFVWSRLTRLIGPVREREDLAQEIFLDVYRALPSFRAESAFRTFLYRIVANVAFEHLSRIKRRPSELSFDELLSASDPCPSPEERAGRRLQFERTWQSLERLKPEKRVAFVLRVVEGLSLEAIGEIVGAKPAAVWARVRAAEEELKTMSREVVRRPS